MDALANINTHCPILILNYGGWEDTLTGLAEMEDERADIWLIDNASPIDRVAEVMARFPEVRIVRMARNLGYAGAYNRAIAMAAAEGHQAVYVLNNDAVLHPGARTRALLTLLENDKVAAVGSLMLHDGGTRVFFDGEWHFQRPWVAADTAHHETRISRQFHGGAYALRLAAFTDVGPFCEEYFLYHEETEWCLRAKARGWEILVDGRSRVDHEGGASDRNYNSSYYRARNRFLAMRRGIELRDRPETSLSIVEYEMLECRNAPLTQRIAIVNGLIDGWLGRFGQRRGWWPRSMTTLLAVALPPVSRVRRKMRHIFDHA